MQNIFKFLREAFSLEYDRASNEEIRESILSGANVKGTNLFILMLAIFIASIGLNMNSTAVIIGAMLISPLMGGIMAIGFGMATNDIKLVRKAFVGLVFQVFICIVTSTIYFSLTPISAARSELLARTTPTIWDVLIAFLGGLAGIIGVTRKQKTNVIPGVAIATALMPPLCTAGYGIATGQIRFFFGAFYLFFINSFFICISTYIIIKMMRIPKKSFLDVESEKRVKLYIYLIGLAVILPSIVLAYQIVAESVYDSNVQRYISNELVFADSQVVRTSDSRDKKEINVALLGKRISQDTIELLQQKLSHYGLSDMKLKVTQTEVGESLRYEDVQALIEKELEDNKVQVALGDRDQEIEILKTELLKYKAQAIDYENMNYDAEGLVKELKTLYPEIISLSLGRAKGYNVETDEMKECLMATIEVNRALFSENQNRIIEWLKIKTGMNEVKLYVDFKPVQSIILEPDEALQGEESLEP